MQVSVNLQGPFSYSILPLLVIILLIIILTVIYHIMKNKKKNNYALIEIKDIDEKDLRLIKQKYINELYKMERLLNENAMSIREAYQSLSVIIRYFVYEVTGIEVLNYTLKEIKKVNMPELYELIQEYYVPEFAEKSTGDAQSSIEKTRKVIEKWN